MANERTFLAYFRTAVVFLSSGLAILHIEFFERIRVLSYFLISLSPFILLGGVWRMQVVKKRILQFYRQDAD